MKLYPDSVPRRNRNRKNNRHRDYDYMNCMGYALGIKDWLHVESSYKKGPEFLEREYGLIPVKRSEMVLGKVYVAYRYCAGDFHFMVRNEKGHWRHKMGWAKAQSISEKEVFNRNGWKFHRLYNSKVYLFVRV